jgi:hypothetical protein
VAATTGPRAVGTEPGGDKARFRVGDERQHAATKGSPQASADPGQEACRVLSADEMDPDSDGIKHRPCSTLLGVNEWVDGLMHDLLCEVCIFHT